MNSINEDEDNSMLYVSFNQDNSFFSVGTERGFRIYQTYPFTDPYEKIMNGGIGVVEMLYKTNFLALMGGGKNPKFNKKNLIIWDDNENKIISELKFTTSIINIKLKKDLLFVVCQKRIYAFDFNTYEAIDTIDTGDNIKELIAINNSPELTILAYPSTKGVNKITIKNYKTKIFFSFTAQDDSISKMSINNDGTLISTANNNGTIIRIHSCIDGAFLQEFKRGHEKAKINYICFDNDTKLMAVSSNRGTIHIFSMGSTIKKLKEHEKEKSKKKEKEKEINKTKENELNEEEQKKENIKNEENKNNFEHNNNNNNEINIKNNNEDNNEINNDNDNDEELPENTKTFFGEIFGSQIEKSFAKVRIKSQDSICAFVKNNKLAIISSDNKYYLAEIDIKKGGDCKIIFEDYLIKNKNL
jgi:WD40 repeat protein